MPEDLAPIADLDTVASWRRHLHAHPELAFAEEATRDFIVTRLQEMGIEAVTRLAGTGLVARIDGRQGAGRGVALRADMDALPITEATDLPHRSTVPGVMHACGHDGHVAMLLGAARELARARAFSGAVHLIFQPAEENGFGGGRAMVEAGLMDLIGEAPVFGLHNWPGLSVGRFAAMPGPMMASMDNFDVTLTGQGGHAAMPEQTRDPIIAAVALIGAVQTLVSRETCATEALVVSVTRIAAGEAYNLIPGTAKLAGTVRSLSPALREAAAARIAELVEAVARLHRVEADLSYERSYPVTVNAAAEAAEARAAAEAAGLSVEEGLAPSMGSEDFAYLLEVRRGAYGWLGSGPAVDGHQLHNPRYDFNDALLPLGIRWWLALVARELGAPA